ncbi:glycosyltransferase family 4 protein [Propionivibrio soli]|uniref:glycosyltransferase family 4 protein n=1 Tax=Propionivibrio soli TaxID=2976531 RepID=UPI0021E9493C
MRILVVSQYFWPENFRINDLVAALCDRGHDVTILTGCPNYPSGKVFPEFRSHRSDYGKFGAADVVRVPLLPRGSGALRLLLNYLSFTLSASLVGALRLRGMAFDAIFVFEPSPITVGIPAVLLRHLKRVPLVFWVLDLWPETLEAIGAVRSSAILKLVGGLVSFIYNRCDLVLAQSRSFIPQIRKYCRGDVRVEYFPSWSDSVFDFSIVAPAREVPAGEGFFNVMFAGNMGDAQDFPAILDAAEILKDKKNIRWLVVGDGRATEWVRSEVDKRRLGQSFLLLGRYPIERMPSFYKHADALLVSLKESPIFAMTIPGKLQSYLASGLPILAMLNGEGAQIISSSGAGLSCRAGDGNALAAAVIQLAEMPVDARKKMGARGLALSRTEFDRETLITRLEHWFAEMANKDRRAGAR